MELPKWFTAITSWPSLSYIAMTSQKLQKILKRFTKQKQTLTLNELFEKINTVISMGTVRRMEQELKLPNVQLPYYEGFNKIGNKYWLGIYKRNYLFLY